MSHNPTIADVRARRVQIKADRKQLAEQDATLAAEDAELEVAERALLRLAAAGAAPQEQPAFAFAGPEIAYPFEITGKETLEQLIERLLESSATPWWQAGQIQQALSAIKGRDIPISSVSPTLSIMKNKGIVARDGLKVASARRVETNKAAEPAA